MKSFKLFLIFTFHTLSTLQEEPTDKIINGKFTSIEEHPYQVSILYTMYHFCGGSIIKSTVVLTAAHCTDRTDRDNIMVRAGVTSFKTTQGIYRKITKFYQHPKFSERDSEDYDISILIIRQLPMSEQVQVIDIIPLHYNLTPGVLGVVTGWGSTKENGPGSYILQSVEVPLLNYDYCNKVYRGRVTDRMICFGYKNGKKDACQGDSGGPIVVNQKLVGIVSWGNGCALADNPGVYTNLQNVEIRQFIMEVMRMW